MKKTDGCWLWTGTTNSKYGSFRKSKTISAHRFSYELHHGPISEGKIVCHRCDEPLCVRPDHLFVGTHAENIADMDRKGRRGCTDWKTRRRFTHEEISEIRRRLTVESQAVIVRDMGIKWRTMYDIVKKARRDGVIV